MAARLTDHGGGVWSSPTPGEVSWLCDEDRHARCSGVVANWSHISGGVVLRPCACEACAHAPDLAAAAVALHARRWGQAGQ